MRRLPSSATQWLLLSCCRITASLRTLRRDTCGAAVVLAAILFPVVIGGMGLGAETGYWYLTQRKLQHAADVSAHAGATRLRAGDDGAAIEGAARNVAAGSGAATPFVEVEVNARPEGPKYSQLGWNGNQNAVEVIISRSQPRLFSAVVNSFYGDGDSSDVTIRAYAIAALDPSSNVACVLALSPNSPGAVTMSGSSSVALEGCDVHSNSVASDSVLMSGSATLGADCVTAVGNVVLGTYATLSEANCPKEQVGIVPDPYATVAEPNITGACRNRNVGTPNSSTPTAATPGNYCNGLTLKGPVEFAPGVYIIHGGDMTVNAGENTRLTGNGVTFFLTGGATLRLNGHARLNLAAPTEGPFAGILFFGDRDDNVSHVVNGTSGSTLQGAIYAPTSRIDYRGNSATTDGCTQLIGAEVTFIGNSTLSSSCEKAGTSDIVSQVVRLVE